jgi:hypothetical protein
MTIVKRVIAKKTDDLVNCIAAKRKTKVKNCRIKYLVGNENFLPLPSLKNKKGGIIC